MRSSDMGARGGVRERRCSADWQTCGGKQVEDVENEEQEQETENACDHGCEVELAMVLITGWQSEAGQDEQEIEDGDEREDAPVRTETDVHET